MVVAPSPVLSDSSPRRLWHTNPWIRSKPPLRYGIWKKGDSQGSALLEIGCAGPAGGTGLRVEVEWGVYGDATGELCLHPNVQGKSWSRWFRTMVLSISRRCLSNARI